MLKFKVGDKVRVTQGWDTIVGYTGVIAIADARATNLPYNVTMDSLPPEMVEEGYDNWIMKEDEIELVED